MWFITKGLLSNQLLCQTGFTVREGGIALAKCLCPVAELTGQGVLYSQWRNTAMPQPCSFCWKMTYSIGKKKSVSFQKSYF